MKTFNYEVFRLHGKFLHYDPLGKVRLGQIGALTLISLPRDMYNYVDLILDLVKGACFLGGTLKKNCGG